jgi:hypothetical protein
MFHIDHDTFTVPQNYCSIHFSYASTSAWAGIYKQGQMIEAGKQDYREVNLRKIKKTPHPITAQENDLIRTKQLVGYSQHKHEIKKSW